MTTIFRAKYKCSNIRETETGNVCEEIGKTQRSRKDFPRFGQRISHDVGLQYTRKSDRGASRNAILSRCSSSTLKI